MMITLEAVSKRYGQATALSQVSFEIQKGQSIAVVGPSGSGKTTLLRLIAGLEPVDEGIISLDGQTASRPGRTLTPNRRGIGFVFQEPALWPHMTVAQNIGFGLSRLPRHEQRRRIADWLEALQIEPFSRRYPHQLSGGEARRVSLARSLAPEPSILLLDEPLVHLDDDLRQTLLKLIRHHQTRIGCTMIYVSHRTEDVSFVAERILYLREGRLESDYGQS